MEALKKIKMDNTVVCPSILAADLANLFNEIQLIKKAGAFAVHVDVMDGCFVNNISFGVPIVNALKNCGLPLDVHLMVNEPMNFIDSFVEAGANILTFHLECLSNLEDCVKKAKFKGCKVGLAVKPSTSVQQLNSFLLKFDVAKLIDLILIMTVEPGFGGQNFMIEMLPKIQQVKQLNLNSKIGVDGGINLKNAKIVKKAGANWLVVGSAIFGSNDYEKTIKNLIRC